jgi:hypothetical protein
MTWLYPKGISLPTAAPLDGNTVVACNPLPGDQAFALSDGQAIGFSVAVSNYTSIDSTVLTVFSALSIDGGAPGGGVPVVKGQTRTFTKQTGNPGTWATS